MSGRKLDWKQVLREPNALGWIGLFVVVIAIGVGTLYFGGGGRDTAAGGDLARSSHGLLKGNP